MSELELDDILVKIGSWNKYQFYVYICLGFASLFSAFQMSYIFTARNIKYRQVLEIIIQICSSDKNGNK